MRKSRCKRTVSQIEECARGGGGIFTYIWYLPKCGFFYCTAFHEDRIRSHVITLIFMPNLIQIGEGIWKNYG